MASLHPSHHPVAPINHAQPIVLSPAEVVSVRDGLHHWTTWTIRDITFARCSCEALTYSDVSGALPSSCPMEQIDLWEAEHLTDIRQQAARDRAWLRGHYRNEGVRLAQTLDRIR